MKTLALALALAYAPLALADSPTPISDNDFCNEKGAAAVSAYNTGKDVDKQYPTIRGFIRNMRDGKPPSEVGAVAVLGFSKGYCMGWLDGARIGEAKGIEEERKKKTF